jgi:hypothetical protein
MNREFKLGLQFAVAVPILLALSHLLILPAKDLFESKDFYQPRVVLLGVAFCLTLSALGCAVAAAIQLVSAGFVSIGRRLFRSSTHEAIENMGNEDHDADDRG